MKIKMLCTVANKDDVRLAPINDSNNTVVVRGLDMSPAQGQPLPDVKAMEVYQVEITLTKL